VYTFDVHSSVARQQIHNIINLDPIHAYEEIGEVIESLKRVGLVLIVPDKGGETRYYLAKYKLPIFVGEKVRDAKTGKLSGFAIPTSIKEYPHALIVDDICDGGGTFIGLAEEIHKLNPHMELNLYVSHGIFSKGLNELFEHFDGIFISDFSFRGPHFSDFKILGGN